MSYEQTLVKIIEPVKRTTITRMNRSKKWQYGYNKEHDIIVISKTGKIGEILEIQNLKIALPSLPVQVHKLQGKKGERKDQQKELNVSLIEIMKSNEIDCIDIKDGQICYNKKNVKKPISKKFLLDILSKYFDGDIKKAEDANDFILNSREETVKESISRKFKKED